MSRRLQESVLLAIIKIFKNFLLLLFFVFFFNTRILPSRLLMASSHTKFYGYRGPLSTDT